MCQLHNNIPAKVIKDNRDISQTSLLLDLTLELLPHGFILPLKKLKLNWFQETIPGPIK